MAAAPAGAVTFLFTDIEESVHLRPRLAGRYAAMLTEYGRVVRTVAQTRGGRQVGASGEALLFAFPRPTQAVATAVAAQRVIVAHPWPEGAGPWVRMGLDAGAFPYSGSVRVGLHEYPGAAIGLTGHGGQILLSEATRHLVAEDPPPGVTFRDLGAHRLRDLRRVDRLFQVLHPDLPARFPPPKALDVLPNNLPAQLTSFIGRERELAELRGLLVGTRLLTLTGAGGCGKTRLALQLAVDMLDEYGDGVWLVQLAALSDPALVHQAVAAALGVREQPGGRLIETLRAHLRPKSLLLVLDNCERVVTACADLVASLLEACPDLRMLTTSRQRLGVGGELSYRVPSLSLPIPRRGPPVDRLAQYEAVRLFVDRAAFSEPGFRLTRDNAETIVQTCQRLDGIPLAIELAAARVNALSLGQIVARLDDRFQLLTAGNRAALPRHQTLRAAIDWSYVLLSEKEQALLRRLSVFSGGWALEAAEAVCPDALIEQSEVLDLLSRLVDKSLVAAEEQRVEMRYRLLETVRQYGRDRLTEAGDAADVRRRHRDWYLRLAEQGEAELWGPGQRIWLDRLEEEHDNLRAALAWSMAEDDNEAGLKLAGALWWFWFVRCHWTEGRAWLERTPSHAGADGVRAKALVGAGFLAWRQGDYDGSVRLSEESLALCKRLQDRRGIALSLHNLGLAARFRDDYARATALGEESLVHFESIGDTWGASLALALLGIAARGGGDYERATHLLGRSVALLRETGETWGIARSLVELAHTVARRGDAQRATALYEECLPFFRGLEDKRGIGFTLVGLGRLAYARADYERARTLGDEAAVLFRQAGDPHGIGASSLLLAGATLVSGDYGPARTLFMESLGVFQKLGNLEGVIASLEGVSDLAFAQGDHDRWTRLRGAADANRERLGIQRAAAESSIHGRHLAVARAALGDDAFTAGYTEGRALTLAQAIEYALEAAKEAPRSTGRPASPLAPREREVALLIARGLSNRAIARRLKISERTAETHVQHILNKLGFGSRAQIAVWAVEQGFLPR